MSDDRRLRESIDYLNRRDDQVHFETTQSENRDAFFEAIREGNDLGVYLPLGLVAPDPPDLDSLSEDPQTGRPRSGEQEFEEHAERLRAALRDSQVIPPFLTQGWWNKVREINVYQPTPALETVDGLLRAYANALEVFRPARDIFQPANTQTRPIDWKTREIKSELEILRLLLGRFEAHLKEHPLTRQPREQV